MSSSTKPAVYSNSEQIKDKVNEINDSLDGYVPNVLAPITTSFPRI